MENKVTFTEYRADGWPLCPVCGEDEPMSFYDSSKSWEYDERRKIAIQEYIDAGMWCVNCGWTLPQTK